MFKADKLQFILLCAILLIFFRHSVEAGKRPFYIIGHMVNSIKEVEHYLDLGANALETDIHFNSDGSVNKVFHGFPCDCFRNCTKSVGLSEYLNYLRKITDPGEPGSYYEKMVLLFLDLKMSTSNNSRRSGKEIARHILKYLWSTEGSREQEVKVLISIESVAHRDLIYGVVEEFQERRQEHRLKNLGFDGGSGNLFAIGGMFINEFKGALNVWQGDGITNCFSALYPDGRLRWALAIRDSNLNNYLSKVYHWTIDLKLRMRLSLDLEIDGFVTNDPRGVVEVLQESNYQTKFRIATLDDDPFILYNKES